MISANQYNQEGKELEKVKLFADIFEIPIKPILIQQAVRTILANRRIAIAHTKTRGEVRGGGRKPWRQKGTGRARHGSIRSPLWKGGGVTFGPRSDRNYKIDMNKKAKKKALLMCLSDKATNKNIIILDKLDLPAPKTKQLVAVLSKLPLKKKILFVLPKSVSPVIKSGRNLPYIKTINADSLNIIDLLNYDTLLVLKEGLPIIKRTFGKK